MGTGMSMRMEVAAAVEDEDRADRDGLDMGTAVMGTVWG